MSRQDSTGNFTRTTIYQDAITATPSAPDAINVQQGKMAVVLIGVNANTTLDATDRIDFKMYKGATKALAEAAGTAVVSADIGGGATIASGIVVSCVLAATGLAGYAIPYVGDAAFITVIPNMEGTHGSADEICISVIEYDLENK